MAVVGSTILKTPQLGILIQGLSWTSALANLGIRSYDSNEHFSIQNKLQHVQITFPRCVLKGMDASILFLCAYNL
jgi:hypothetical protein|uniref:Uncharacterized protein n=1 Tax=Populus trichocarpa TaxID=3694 RepID=A0A2K1Z775_POPTR